MTDPHARRRRTLLATMAVSGAALLASCASMLGPREVDVPLWKLQASLDRRFPVDNRLLELFDVRLTRPQLAVHEGDRVSLTVDASLAQSLLREPLAGSLVFSGRLYVDPARSGVFMAEPRIERFAIGGMDGLVQRQLTRVANGLIDAVVLDVPVYTFRMEDLRYAGVQYVPTRIATTSNGLRISLEPARKP